MLYISWSMGEIVFLVYIERSSTPQFPVRVYSQRVFREYICTIYGRINDS